MAKQRGGECERANGFELGQWAREEVDQWRNDDDQRHGRETLVLNASDACAEHGRSRVLRSRHRCSGGTRNAVDDGRHGCDYPSASLDWIQRCQSGIVVKRSRKDSTRGVEVFVAAGRDQVGKSKSEANPRRTESGRPSDEGEGVASD